MLKFLSFTLFLLTISLPNSTLAKKKGPQGPTPVITAPVKIQNFSDNVEALGTTKANESVIITPDTAAKVTAIHFEDGQFVKKGDLLVALNKSEESAALSAARASLSDTQSSYNRAKTLQNNNALSKGTVQERLSALKQSKAMVNEVKARIDKRDITAPFDGVLGLREVSVGTLVQPGYAITTIDDLSQIKVDFDVPAVFLPSLKSGMSIIGQVEAFGGREFKGEVHTVNTQINAVTRTVKVRAVIPNADGVLKPGLLMRIKLFKNERQALLIPEEALIKRGAENFVYVIKDKNGKTIAAEQKIDIGTRQPGVIEVLSGLNEEDQVVAHGTLKVRDGAEVTVRAVEREGDTPLDRLLKQEPPSPSNTPVNTKHTKEAQ